MQQRIHSGRSMKKLVRSSTAPCLSPKTERIAASRLRFVTAWVGSPGRGIGRGAEAWPWPGILTICTAPTAMDAGEALWIHVKGVGVAARLCGASEACLRVLKALPSWPRLVFTSR